MEKTSLVFVGTYTEPILFGTGKVLQGKGKGIYIYRLHENSGKMELLSVAEGIVNPSYLAFSGENRRLFAVNELKQCDGKNSGALSAFVFDGGSMNLAFLNKRLTDGTDPCHVAVDGTGKFAAVANFMSGSIIVYPILADGSLGEASAFVQHRGSSVDKARQAGPHAHSIVFDPSNRYMLVPDLGLDKIVVYDFDSRNGSLRLSDERCIGSEAGVGPRYLEFHPSGRLAYVVNELGSTIDAFAVDIRNFAFRRIQSISALPEEHSGASTCADLHISPSGDFLYASNRGHDSLAIFGIEKESGRLGLIGHESTRGKTPRNFAIDRGGRFLLAANQDSDTLVVFQMNAVTGKLEYTGTTVDVPTPVCVKVIDEP